MADSTTTQELVELQLMAPMLIQVGLMLLITFWLAWARVGSVARKKVDMRDVSKHGWQGWIKQAGDNYSNQYEAPLLFFILCILMTLIDISSRINSIDTLFITTAWVFVVSRFAHAIIHLSFNHILTRFLVFLIGVLCLAIMFVLVTHSFLNLKEYGVYREFGV